MDWKVEISGEHLCLENEVSFEHLFLSRQDAEDLREVLAEGLKMLPFSLQPNDPQHLERNSQEGKDGIEYEAGKQLV